MAATRSLGRRVWIAALVTAGVLLTLLLVLYAWAVRHPFIGGIGDRIVLDDFGFRLQEVRELPAERLGWRRLELEIQVENLAQRVDFTFDPNLARLVHPGSPDLRPLPDAAGAPPLLLAAGATGLALLRFDLPAEMAGYQLRMSFARAATDTGWLAGALNVLDTVMFGEQRLNLAAP